MFWVVVCLVNLFQTNSLHITKEESLVSTSGLSLAGIHIVFKNRFKKMNSAWVFFHYYFLIRKEKKKKAEGEEKSPG